jgi:hypothetical protein
MGIQMRQWVKVLVTCMQTWKHMELETVNCLQLLYYRALWLEVMAMGII